MLTIGELARLARTTSRTVRHYHQIGLMPEPRRSEGGYRQYGTSDLLTLLRIRRLGALGIPLVRIGALLEAGERDAQGVLDELDQELAAQARILEEQRRVLALLRAHSAHPELPEEFAPILAALRDAGTPDAQLTKERELILLVSSLGGTFGLLQIYQAQLASSDLPEYVELSNRLTELDDAGADDPRVVPLAQQCIRLVKQGLPELRRSWAGFASLDSQAERTLTDHARASLSPAQWRVNELVAAELEKLLTEGPG